ncbi:hypothetical protein AK812_SmicGene36840 [Symbiodinium microadriaticum]|uniref:Uncharacterized protein n=1 Tax=Symbiodinium microadriaticum TaxID=2951 RepID=A0A1Q9CHU5_SYMMI|nr:hypothetical protein AK812_SmicGene36840 [Symbiodinium microadriaticum]
MGCATSSVVEDARQSVSQDDRADLPERHSSFHSMDHLANPFNANHPCPPIRYSHTSWVKQLNGVLKEIEQHPKRLQAVVARKRVASDLSAGIQVPDPEAWDLRCSSAFMKLYSEPGVDSLLMSKRDFACAPIFTVVWGIRDPEHDRPGADGDAAEAHAQEACHTEKKPFNAFNLDTEYP